MTHFKHIQRTLAFILALCTHAAAQAPPSYDFDFATITSPNNPAYPGDPVYGELGGRGSVSYEYRISRMEVTTAQWVEFVNTFSTRGGSWSSFALPSRWGAQLDPTYSGPGYRWQVAPGVPDAERYYVGGISWRTAAKYANWLHNDKAAEPWALEDGAYDTSTFGAGSVGLTFTDQWTRNPDAKFWIPSLDEWMKAAHFDPDKYGPGRPGWWEYSYMSNEPPIPGPPGAGQTSGGYEAPGFWEIPLGAYPDMRSPWGLLDTSGGATEWTEEVWMPSRPTVRFLMGTAAGDIQPPSWHPDMEAIWVVGEQVPWSAGPLYGLRVASAVPNPATAIVVALAGGLFLNQRRRP